MQGFRMLVLSGLFVGLFGNVALAQATLFDSSALSSGCLQGNCETTLRAQISRLQANHVQGQAFNSQLGTMAALLFGLAQQATPIVADQITLALLVLAEFSTDAAQRNSLIQLASALADGSADLFTLDDPFAVSPN